MGLDGLRHYRPTVMPQPGQMMRVDYAQRLLRNNKTP